MILVESTYWPLVVVGAVPDSPDGATASCADEESLWSGGDVRLAVVIAGHDARAVRTQEEVFAWLCRHRERLRRCVYRTAWIFEDERMRRTAERWLSLAGDRLFRGDVTTFRSVRSAVSWLEADTPEAQEPSAGASAPQPARAAGGARGREGAPW